jgi:hypothetical protein
MKKDVTRISFSVADDVRYALELLKQRYGADDFEDSRKEAGSRRPTRLVKLSKFGVEIGVPLNGRDLTLYMRNLTLDGKKLTDLLSPEKVKGTYPGKVNPARSIKDSVFLGTASGHESVLLKLDRADLEPLFARYFANTAEVTTSTASAVGSPHASSRSEKPAAARAPIDAEAFGALLDRRSEVGQAGELIAVSDELERLAQLGCADPHLWVEQISVDDVGRGYDIASTWPGQERFIEVKSTTREGSDFFLTENECDVLNELGEKGWIYRVVLESDGSGVVQYRWQNPMSCFTHIMQPAVWRIKAPGLSD